MKEKKNCIQLFKLFTFNCCFKSIQEDLRRRARSDNSKANKTN